MLQTWLHFSRYFRKSPHKTVHHNMEPARQYNTMHGAATVMFEDVNEAYNILKDPLRRAACILALRGQDPFDESANIQMPHDFLERQMELRERLEELEGQSDHAAIQNMDTELQKEIDQEFVSLGDNLDAPEPNNDAAVAGVLRLRYLINCQKEVYSLIRD